MWKGIHFSLSFIKRNMYLHRRSILMRRYLTGILLIKENKVRYLWGNPVNEQSKNNKKDGAAQYIGRQDEMSLRLATTQDAEILCRWWNDGKVMAHAGFPNGLGTDADEIVALIKNGKRNNRRMIIEIDSEPIGEMNYRIQDKLAEIGIKICDFNYQEKGYGTKALKMLIKYLFSEMDVDKIILDTNLKNTRAQHVYEKIGFQKVRVNIDSWKDQLGELQSSVDYELRKADYIEV
jgi:RimJ/RimL family protein N-acetyltransferase